MNTDALVIRNMRRGELAQGHNMKEVFGCAKMYFGPKPDLPEQEIFAVTTFELS